MPLAIGQSLGNYQIAGPLGKGGMGEVYRAKDTKLGREVAIKVLPAAFALHAERLARFEREAKVLASLNHPNIATIYAVEESPAGKALVMELVEGDSLKGPLDLETALKYSAQIASALEAAHEKGITHRDLKPANIMLTRDGVVKVLDFGLAAVTQPSADTEDGTAATLTMSPTQAGTILGTAPYMSPEQASGKVVDRRTDIWAFGVVLWEVLTGKRLFVGDTIAHTLAAVLKDEPDWTQVPARVRRLLQACLAKDVKQRLQSIADWRHLLVAEEPAAAPQVVAPASKLPWIAAAAMALLAGVALWGWLKPVPAEPRQLAHFVTATPQGITGNPIGVSRDGSRIAFAGVRAGAPIYLRTLDQPDVKPVPGTEGGAFPAFSPDGQWIAFFAGGAMKKVPVAGGAALTLATGLSTTSPMSWGDDDQILFGGGELRRISSAGGEPVLVAKPDPEKGEVGFVAPSLLPGGKYILVNVLTPKGLADFRVIALDAQSGEKKTLLEGVGVTWFMPSGSQPGIGHLVYGRNRALFGATLNANSLQAGSPVPLVEGVLGAAGLTVFGVSQTGTLAYAGGGNLVANGSIPTWVDRQGTETALGVPTRTYFNPRISPDGGRIAFQITDISQSIDIQLWVHDVTRGTTTRVTFDRSSASPVWTPDGKRLIYASGTVANPNATLLSVAADGSGQPVTLLGEGPSPVPQTISPDGKVVMGVHAANVVSNASLSSGSEVWVLPLSDTNGKAADAKSQPFLDTRFVRGNFRFSPDGKWLAFESNDTGRNEVYVVPYPGPGGKSQVSTDGGTQARWNQNGRELFFRNGDKMMAVDVETGAAFRAGAPHMLFEKAASDYDVTPDGRRFLMLKPPAAAGGPANDLHVILNWFDELRRKAPLGK